VSTRIAILQSNYIPWKGYLDLIRSVDAFVLYDHAQYTKNDWRNRNRIKTPTGLRWLTIPVDTSGKHGQPINEARVVGNAWAASHWSVLQQEYREAPGFEACREPLRGAYAACAAETHLSRINHRMLTVACGLLGITTPIRWSTDYDLVEGKTERLVSICQQAGATRYLSGPAARDYIRPELFAAAGITLEYADYSGYPEYPQLYPPFAHGVSVLDLLFNVGPEEAGRYLKRL
jgi:hypothetical protein